MNDSLITSVTTVATALIGVAIIALILSRNSQTTQIVTAGSSAFTGVLGAALSPVTQSNSASLF